MSDKSTDPLQITHTNSLDGNQLLVQYSDESTAVYDVKQLASLAPTQCVTVQSLDEPEVPDL